MSEPAPKRARTGMPRYDEVPPPSTWTFTVRTTPKSTNAYIYNGDGSKVKFQLPRCRVPFGIQDAANAGEKEESKSRPNLELDVSDPGLIAWAREADAAAIDYVTANSRELMRKEMRKDFVEQLFRRVIPEPRNNEYNPLLRTKITKTGNYATRVRVVTDPGSRTTALRHRPGTLDEIERGDEVIVVVDASNIWFANNSAGMALTATNILVFKKASNDDDMFTVDGVAGVEVETSAPPMVSVPLTHNLDPFE